MRGYIKSLSKVSGGGFNEKGEPIPDSSNWLSSVECLYQANVYNNRGTYQDGVFTQSEFIITTKDLTFTATEIQLLDKDSNLICQKQVQRLELLESVKRVRIVI